MSGKITDPKVLYEQGLSDNKNGRYGMALQHFKAAAEQGHDVACFYIGVLYLNGRGVKRDPEAAEHWFLKAAELGVPEAEFNLAHMYYYDDETKKTYNTPVGELYREARDRARRAMEAGVEGAEALMLRISTEIHDMQPKWYWGDEVDEEEVASYERAAFAESVYGKYELMRIYGCCPGHEMDGELRLARLLPFCEKGYAEAQRTLAQMYQRGDGIEKDMEKALYWYKKAADQGYTDAQRELADLYYEGEDVEQNLPEAFRLYSLTAEKRNDFGELGLAQMYERGDYVEKNIEEAIYWYLRSSECRMVRMAFALDKLSELDDAYPDEYIRACERFEKLPSLEYRQ